MGPKAKTSAPSKKTVEKKKEKVIEVTKIESGKTVGVTGLCMCVRKGGLGMYVSTYLYILQCTLGTAVSLEKCLKLQKQRPNMPA